jgi:hypothetical protein
MNSEHLTKLQIAQSIRDFHHNALWEEEKHFTWLVSILITAMLLVFTNDKVTDTMRGVAVLVLSLAGLFISATALVVLRRESLNFQTALHRFVRQHNQCFPDIQLEIPATANPNKSFLRLAVGTFRRGSYIRDAFQRLFIFAFCLFFITLISGAVYWARDARPPNKVAAANGSQPIRSETNRTSSAAGSRR